MCTILLAWRCREELPLLVAANRDEFHDRAAAPAGWWPDRPEVLGGRDLAGGGTWLGVDRRGRVAALANYREPGAPAGGLSRGRLVVDFLASDERPAAFGRAVVARGDRFAGFTLVAADAAEIVCVGNRERTARTLAPGVHGFSNGGLDAPWPKVRAGRARIQELLAAPSLDAAALLDVLSDRTVPPDSELPHTGIGLEKERLLGAMFVVSPDYGTRASTAVIVRAEGTVTFLERTFSRSGAPTGERRFEFRRRG
ncbi:MAG: NRDE family protein [Planctomycetes bacterium]|nr:NRDE family protein [Planctomycetota bacterium]